MGNRNSGPKATDSYTYDSGNEQLSYNGKMLLLNTNDQNEYDLNGNLIKKTQTEGKVQTITNYAYDDENRLTSVIIQKGEKIKQVTFSYDPFGRRISQSMERDDFNINLLNPPTYPQITNYVYDEQNIIAEYDQNNKQIASYIHGPNIDEPLSAEIRNNRIYYHADGLGSITAITNHMGMTVQKYDYDAFGNIKCSPFPVWIKQPYMYTAREYDHETGLYYYRARYYDPKAGRFITRDPIRFGGGDYNLYNYVENNPVNGTDPYGLTRLTFNVRAGILIVDPERAGRSRYTIRATSGKGNCMNNPDCECKEDIGPIPRGNYTANNSKLVNPNFIRDILTTIKSGDYGDWRIPLNPSAGTNTFDRFGFYLHGGLFAGSAGCIDIGGGVWGNASTNKLLNDIKSDPDGIVPLVVQ